MKQFAIGIFLTSLLFLSCKTKEGQLTEGECSNCVDAMVSNYGDPALDGCGWVIDVSSTIYKPQNLPLAYKIDSLAVQIRFKALDSVNCGMIQNAFREISISEIRKKL